jgi:hypothetical protein
MQLDSRNMRYGSCGKAPTVQRRHAKARTAIENRCNALRRLGYRFQQKDELKTLAGLVDMQERLVLAQLSSASIHFAKQTVLELVSIC